MLTTALGLGIVCRNVRTSRRFGEDIVCFSPAGGVFALEIVHRVSQMGEGFQQAQIENKSERRL